MGILSGDFPGNITIQNSRFARDGGSEGPSHNIYIGGGNGTSTFSMDHTIIEQANNGYELKTRAKNTILNCNIFRGDIDPVNKHSSDIDFAIGSESHLTGNLIYEGADGPSESVGYFVLWGGDLEGGTPLANNFMVATGNYFVNDYAVQSGIRNIFYLFEDQPVPSPSPPYTIGPNAYATANDGSGVRQLAQYSVNNGSFVFPPGETVYPTRTAAGMPNVTYPIPAACTAPIGNLAIP